MANATRKTKTVVENVYTLTLNEAEATVLLDIFDNIGGHAQTTRRGLVDGIRNALFGAGAERGPRDGLGYPVDFDSSNGSIYFIPKED